MLIAIVIPTFNRVDRLAKAVQSVLAQTHSNVELIVVDDGSTDATQAFLMGNKDKRLRVLRQENQGVSKARNAGIIAARAEMIALLDSDDVWLSDKLEKQLSFMSQGGWEISQCDEQWIRHGRRVNPRDIHAKRAGWIFEPSLELCLVSPSCVMFSRRCWEAVGPFDESLPACEDYDLWLRCSLKYPVGFLPEPLVEKYGGHPDQLSRKIIGLDLFRVYSLVKILRSERLSLDQRQRAQEALRNKLSRYIKGCLKRDKPEEADRVRAFASSVLESALPAAKLTQNSS